MTNEESQMTKILSSCFVIRLSFDIRHLAHVSLHRIFPSILSLQDRFDQLADSAAATRKLGSQDSRSAELRGRIGHSSAEAHGPHNWQIGQVVADVADLLGRQVTLANDFLGGRELVFK